MSSAQTRLPLSPSGNVAGDDPGGEPLDDRRLAHARLADQHRIVLRPAGQNLDHATDLLVPADDRVELAGLCERSQVLAELLERLVGAFGILRGHPLGAAHVLQRCEQRVARDDVEREQQMLGRHVVVLERAHLVLSAVEQLRERSRDLRLLLRSGDRRLCGEGRFRLPAEGVHGRARALDEGARKLLVEQGEQEVLGIELRVAVPAGELAGRGNGLLRLDRQLPKVHVSS